MAYTWQDILSGAQSNYTGQNSFNIFNPGTTTPINVAFGGGAPRAGAANTTFTPDMGSTAGMGTNGSLGAFNSNSLQGGMGAFSPAGANGSPSLQQLMGGPGPSTGGVSMPYTYNGNQWQGLPPLSQYGIGNPGVIPPSQEINKIAYSGISPQEQRLQQMFQGASTGRTGGPIAKQLFGLGMGILPTPMADLIRAQTNESFGKMGARFGTDLGRAETLGLGEAGAQQSLNAIQQILGLGGTTAGLQFQRGESGLQRALQDLMSQRQTDMSQQMVMALLSGLGGGGG